MHAAKPGSLGDAGPARPAARTAGMPAKPLGQAELRQRLGLLEPATVASEIAMSTERGEGEGLGVVAARVEHRGGSG